MAQRDTIMHTNYDFNYFSLQALFVLEFFISNSVICCKV